MLTLLAAADGLRASDTIWGVIFPIRCKSLCSHGLIPFPLRPRQARCSRVADKQLNRAFSRKKDYDARVH